MVFSYIPVKETLTKLTRLSKRILSSLVDSGIANPNKTYVVELTRTLCSNEMCFLLQRHRARKNETPVPQAVADDPFSKHGLLLRLMGVVTLYVDVS